MSRPRPPLLTAALAAALARLARLLAWTWRWSLHGKEPVDAALAEGPLVYAFWHGAQLPLALAHADQGVVGLASRSEDGALLAAVIGRLGYGVARGSSSRSGVTALRVCQRILTEDRRSGGPGRGRPRGPRHRAAAGAAALARQTRAPIACVGVRCPGALHLGSWDRFCLPLPFTRIELHYSLISVPPEAVPSVETLRVAVQDRLLALTGPEIRAARSP